MRSTSHLHRMRTVVWALGAALLLTAAPRLGVAQGTPAQGTPTQREFLRIELTKRGLTEAEARPRLAQNGIVLEQIPPAELPQVQPRIIAILDQLAAEKKGMPTTVPTAGTPIIIMVPPAPAAVPDTLRRAAVDSSMMPQVPGQDSTRIYGHDIFTDQSLRVFQTTEGVRAPDSYVLGTGDQLRISIFGTSQVDLLLEINDEGFIQPTGVPKIFLRGLTLAQARPLLRARLAGFYSFNADQYAVTLQTARTVTVNVFGETTRRGSFAVSALNTALNALVAAGGPTPIGSVREIQLVRGQQRKTLDVYAFLNDPARLFDFDLQHNDVLFVPVAKTVVAVEGAVKRPMRYEVLPGEDLAQLLRFAGG